MGVQQKPTGFLNFKRLLKAQFLRNGSGLKCWGRGKHSGGKGAGGVPKLGGSSLDFFFSRKFSHNDFCFLRHVIV